MEYMHIHKHASDLPKTFCCGECQEICHGNGGHIFGCFFHVRHEIWIVSTSMYDHAISEVSQMPLVSLVSAVPMMSLVSAGL